MPVEPTQHYLNILESLGDNEGYRRVREKWVEAIQRMTPTILQFHDDHAKWAYEAGRLQGLIEAERTLAVMIQQTRAEIVKKEQQLL